MSANTIALSQKPASVSRSADWMVLGLLLFALAAGALLRQSQLFATYSTSVGGLTLALPADSVPVSSEPYEAVTPDGLTVRVTQLPAPALGLENIDAMTTQRAMAQGQALPMYRTISTDVMEVAGQPSGVLDYAYVSDQSSFFSSGMEIVQGREVLVGQGESLYAVTVEGPESASDALEAFWPRLLASLRFDAAPTGGQ